MNRTIKGATVKRYHYDSHDQLRGDLNDFISAHNFARRLRTLKGLIPHEYICEIWTNQPELFKLNSLHQMLGLSTFSKHRTGGSDAFQGNALGLFSPRILPTHPMQFECEPSENLAELERSSFSET